MYMSEKPEDQEDDRPRVYVNFFGNDGLPIRTIEIGRLDGGYFQLTLQTAFGDIDIVLARGQLADLHRTLGKALGNHEPQTISFGEKSS